MLPMKTLRPLLEDRRLPGKPFRASQQQPRSSKVQMKPNFHQEERDRSTSLNRAQTHPVDGRDQEGPPKLDLPPTYTKGRPLTTTRKPMSKSPTKPSCGSGSIAGATTTEGTQLRLVRECRRERSSNRKHGLHSLLLNSISIPGWRQRPAKLQRLL
ncbi:hypothetical protein GJ744_006367 [Endocarpon pusillum]|uniref:Uncharacterized protein n=1 Tax=Endocarpon pusillum TaxID=364733 RepID=A0A8H7E884_9EURO|nr:hypothetical protein GJ744_006367 [Endocarpon pusillum]